ncbi:hypothetical protein [Staphylococcus succinus]|uniref:hypothetical protein n=1 Tax=Staphylococcus succinus TaxID=61015 RepID=UPI001C040BD3|nr:hypothetical protein [Staphylococcus succinus]MBU0437778.1 hypothetical protein [Staphylococcus succinus]
MKIKTKKQLNLPQLIEWAMKNDIKNKDYRANDTAGYISEVYFSETGLPIFSSMVDKQDTFTITTEEEITEETVLSKVLIVFKNESTEFIEGLSVEDIYKSSVDSIYHVRNDKAMILIWTSEKGLVE